MEAKRTPVYELKYYGQFAETCPVFAKKLPSIVTGRRLAEPHPLKQEILGYLRSGVTCFFVPGPSSRDPFCDPPQILDVSTVYLYVNKWARSRTIAYFVEKYDLAVPEEFIAHMIENAWKIF